MNPYSVFISRKSSDALMAKEVYDFLQNHGIQAFDSDISLHEIGVAEYQTTIDSILDNAEHLIVIGSTIDNFNSSWVKTEWEAFENEKRSGRKTGNLIVIINKKIKIEELPLALRQKQVFKFEDKNFEKLLPYLSDLPKNYILPEPKKNSEFNKNKRNIVLFFIIAAITVAILYFINMKTEKQPKAQKINVDSLFISTKNKFLNEGLDKNVAFDKFKEAIKIDIKYAPLAKDVFDQKAIKTPYLKDKYLQLSEKILIYADSIHKAN